MDPVKYVLYKIINKKCTECKDFSFCKLPFYYNKLEEPTIKDLLNLKRCLFFKKQQSLIQYVQSRI